MRLMVLLLRAGFELVETYDCSERPPLDYPLAALGGIHDAEATRKALET